MKLSSIGSHSVVVGMALLAASAVSIASGEAAFAGRQSVPREHWRVVARTPGALDAIVAPTRTSAWAFGWIGRPGGTIDPIARHWNGHRWIRVTIPRGVSDSGMACAGASSPDNVWAFAGAGASAGNPPASGAALRLRGGRWVLQKNFPGSYVTGCDVLGPRDVWVFGGNVAGLGPGVGTWHLSRSGWALQKTGHLVLFNASVVSANDIWATGADISNHGLRITPVVAVWNGRRWLERRSIDASLPRQTGQLDVGLTAINARSANDVWVAAEVAHNGTVIRAAVVHWNGHRWRRVKATSPGYHLPNAVPDGHGGWWAPPFIQNTSAPYLLHESNGRWTRFALPVRGADILDSFSLARVPHSRSMLAAGPSGLGGVILARGRTAG